MKRRFVAMLLAAVLLLVCAVPALAAAPKVKKTEYEGNGVVEVDFTSKSVTYKNVRVTVKDADGTRLTARILDRDNDEISFKVSGLKAARRYTYTISGVRAGKSGSYGKVSGSFKTPSNKPTIKKVTFDAHDKELEIEFATKVQFRMLTVTVKDADGNTHDIRNLEEGSDDLEMTVRGMKKGLTYTVTISGVRVKGVGSYTSVSKKFTA